MRYPRCPAPLPRLAALALALALLLGGAAPARAEWSGPNEDEQELLRTIRQEKLIRARELAEKLLRRRPESFIARYALALVHHDEEANLPRALYQVRLAQKKLEERFGDPPADRVAATWHAKMLGEEATILGEMDRRKEQLKVMDRHDRHYRPKMDRWRIWPLLKEQRFEEALALAKEVAASPEINTRISGLNGMIAIESERLRARACYQVGMKAVLATDHQSCILNQNTAEAAFAVYKFGDAERLALKSIQAPMQDCPSSAYPHLANLYLLRGDFQRAMNAIRSARQSHVERRYRQQFEMSHTAWLARLLFTLGKFEQAVELARRVTKAPDRVGMTSFSGEVMKVVYYLDLFATLGAEMEAVREASSVQPLADQPQLLARLVELGRQRWTVGRRIARLLSRSDELQTLVRPYLKPLPPWHAGSLVEALGSGVVLQAVRRARAREAKEPVPGTEAYFDALEAEVAYREGELARALSLAQGSIKGLPRAEKLLRGRLLALAADSARRLGRGELAAKLYDRTLETFPTALRIVGVPLPARVLAGEAPLARQAGERLLGSRRLDAEGDLGFVVRVTGDRKAGLRVCLEGRGGRRVACADDKKPEERSRRAGDRRPARPAPKDGSDSDEERLARLLSAFHEKVFAPKIDLTQWDINSLDGSAVRGDADDVLRGVLGGER